jgi:hypothetical protein
LSSRHGTVLFGVSKVVNESTRRAENRSQIASCCRCHGGAPLLGEVEETICSFTNIDNYHFCQWGSRQGICRASSRTANRVTGTYGPDIHSAGLRGEPKVSAACLHRARLDGSELALAASRPCHAARLRGGSFRHGAGSARACILGSDSRNIHRVRSGRRASRGSERRKASWTQMDPSSGMAGNEQFAT